MDRMVSRSQLIGYGKQEFTISDTSFTMDGSEKQYWF